MKKEQIERLIDIASAQRRYSYAPYSEYRVGAALLAGNGKIYTGCNVENAAFSPSICAERTAVVKAVSEGVREFVAICIVGGRGETPEGYSPPCGMCRQALSEFCGPDMEVYVGKGPEEFRRFTLGELLPHAFDSLPHTGETVQDLPGLQKGDSKR